MVRLAFFRVREDKIERLRWWMDELAWRKDEVLETFEREGTRYEAVYLLPFKDGPVLLYAMDVDDDEQARQAFQASSLPIDDEHKQIMKEIVAGRAEVEQLWACSGK